jgi:hypothetical protein
MDVDAKMNTTKSQAYSEITEDGSRSRRRAQVLEIIKANPGCSRNDIERIGRIRLSSVCGRVAELLGDDEIVQLGEKKDPITKKTVEMLFVKIIKGEQQLSMAI